MDKNKVIARIKKLLALGGSPVEAEAVSAAQKANDLLRDYNLSLSDLERGDQQDLLILGVFWETDTMSPWFRMVAEEVALWNYCRLFAEPQQYKDPKGKVRLRRWQKFIGKSANVQVARSMTLYLIRHILAKSQQRKDAGMAFNQDYEWGAGTRLVERIHELRLGGISASAELREVVMTQDGLIEPVLKALGAVEVAPSQRYFPVTLGAFHEGREDADKISLSTQLPAGTL